MWSGTMSLVLFKTGLNYGVDSSLCVYDCETKATTIVVAFDPVYKGWQQIELFAHPHQVIIEIPRNDINDYKYILATKSGNIGVKIRDEHKS